VERLTTIGSIGWSSTCSSRRTEGGLPLPPDLDHPRAVLNWGVFFFKSCTGAHGSLPLDILAVWLGEQSITTPPFV
jgi:hypothetical protein